MSGVGDGLRARGVVLEDGGAGRPSVRGTTSRARRISRSAKSEEAALILVEGVGTQEEDSSVLFCLFLGTIFTTTVGIIYAIKSHSLGIVTEVTSEAVDMIGYALNLYCMKLCVGKSLAYKERMEFRTAVLSTGLLVLAAVRIGLMCYAQIKCSGDINFSGGSDIACALVQDRPKPWMVIGVSFFMLSSYVPVLVLFAMGKGDIGSYDPQEDVNKASALLHAKCDIATQVSFICAAVAMLNFPAQSVEIDASASAIVMLFLITASAQMWYEYMKPPLGDEPAQTACA